MDEYTLSITEWLRASETKKNHKERWEFYPSRALFRFVVFRGYLLTDLHGIPRKTFSRLPLWHKYDVRYRAGGRDCLIWWSSRHIGFIWTKRLKLAFYHRAPMSMTLEEFHLIISTFMQTDNAYRAWNAPTYASRPLWWMTGNRQNIKNMHRPNTAPYQFRWLDP